MKQKHLFTIVLMILSTLLLYSNTELLLRFTESRSFWTIASRTLFAGAFSSITVLLISIYPRVAIVILSGILDAMALFLEFFPFAHSDTALTLTAIYFAAYGGYIVIVSGLYSHSSEANISQEETLDELKAKLRSLQNRINATKSEEKRAELLAQKAEIQKKIGKIIQKA